MMNPLEIQALIDAGRMVLKSHTPRKWKCVECGRIAKDADQIARHIQRQHSTTRGYFVDLEQKVRNEMRRGEMSIEQIKELVAFVEYLIDAGESHPGVNTLLNVLREQNSYIAPPGDLNRLQERAYEIQAEYGENV